ncbi:glycosyltransferase [Streptomyces sp. NPDC087420]|uniref:glycosyltransferase n=1 Tax=Streptomyces sp. NPDC087420 TaxID=3365785 RepID=UPI003834302E
MPLLPLARAFRARGDEVALMVPASLVPVFADEDVDMLAAGADSSAVMAEVTRRTGLDVRTNSGVEVEAFVTTRLDLSVEECVPAVQRWRPDLVIHDPLDFVGPYLAAVRGVPHAVLTFGADVSAAFRRTCADRAVRDYAARGVPWQEPRWVLDICPPALQVDGWQPPPGRLPLRPEAHRAPAGASPRPPDPVSGRPRILITFGTLFTDPAVLGPLISELTAHGAGVRVTLGTTTSVGDFTVDHARVTFEEFLPYDLLLDGIDVVVAHGGAGTNLGALAAGCPLVLIPQGADQKGHAERVAAAGAAVHLDSASSDPAALARTVLDVAAQPGPRANARNIARQIAAMPAPGEVAAQLAAELAA